MELSLEKKTEIDSILEKESNSLNSLKETLQRSSQLTKGMLSILSSFEDRLGKLEHTILPVYNETNNLQKRQENIEKALVALDHVISFYNISKDVESVIKDGPTNGLDVYLQSTDKLKIAINYFENNNPSSPEIHNLQSLYDTATDALEKEFRSVLTRESKPVPLILILDFTLVDEELGNEDDKGPILLLSERTTDELSQISKWLVQNKREDFMNVYSTIRSNTLSTSLQRLKDHQKSSSGNSNTLAPHSSPALSRTRMKDTPPRKTSRIFQQALMKQASKTIMKYSQTVEYATGISLGHRRQGSLMELKEDILDAEVEFYQTCVIAIFKLMQCEHQLMQNIIPSHHQKAIFERIVQPALDSIVQDGENIASRAKKCIGKHDFGSALVVFPIMKHVISIKPEFDQLLNGCQANIVNKIPTVIQTFHSTGAKALDDFVDSIKNDPDRQVPKDGTVHELTSNVMMFLEQLLDYTETIGSILIDDPLYMQSLSQFKEEDRTKVAVGIYIIRVLTMLYTALNNKSEAYNDAYLKAIFRLNNLHYILKSLQRNGLLELVQLYSNELEDHYTDLILEQKRLYSQSWSRVLHYVLEAEKPFVPSPHGFKIKDKDRQNIKDKFTGFNKEIEDILKVQKGYAIPDVELRESLKRENKEYILPKYNVFYDKYINLPFTKNTEKYIKYTPTQVSNLIDKFFDVAA